jgi:polar amino acid transport system substrate-binding protein
MKVKPPVLFLVVASLFGSSLLFPGAAAADTLTVVADSWCPYNCVPGSAAPGFGIEILQAIFEPKGIKVVYTTMPWAQALKDVQAGKYGAAIGASRKDAAGWPLPEEEIAISRNALFVKRGSTWRYTGPQSLAGKKLGVIEGYLYDSGGELDTWIEKNPASVVVASGDDPLGTLVRKLLLGEVDALIEDRLVFNLKAKGSGVTDKIQEAGVAFELPIFVGFSPARPQSKRYVEIYNQGVRDMRKSMALAGILKKYGVADFKK